MNNKKKDIKFTVTRDDVKTPKVHNYKQTELLSTYCDRRK